MVSLCARAGPASAASSGIAKAAMRWCIIELRWMKYGGAMEIRGRPMPVFRRSWGLGTGDLNLGNRCDSLILGTLGPRGEAVQQRVDAGAQLQVVDPLRRLGQ